MNFKKEEYTKCLGKTSYHKKTALTLKNSREKKGAKRLRVYECPRCGLYHLTHQTVDKHGQEDEEWPIERLYIK